MRLAKLDGQHVPIGQHDDYAKSSAFDGFLKPMKPHIQHSRSAYSSRKLRDNTLYQIALVLCIIAIGLAYLAWARYAPL